VAVPGRPLDEVILERSLDLGATWTRLRTVAGEEPFRFHAKVPKDVPLLVRARAADVLGVVGLSRTIALGGGTPPPPAPPAFELVTLGTWAEVRTAGGIEWRDPTFSARPWGEGTRLVLDPRSLTSAPVRCEGLDPWGRVVQLTVDPPPRIGSGAVLPGPRGLASYRFGSGVLPQEAFAIVREKPAPRGEPELRPVGPLFVLDTGGVPWVGEYELTLLPDRADGFDATRTGVFVRGSSGLSWVSSARGESGWTARTGTPFGVGLFEDRQAPEIGPPRVEQSEGRTRLLFLARDRGAGVDCDDVEVLVGGVPWVHELDDETGDVVAYPAVRPSSGATVPVDVRVVDRCGNVSRRKASVVFP
jgi:hypothetical protein